MKKILFFAFLCAAMMVACKKDLNSAVEEFNKNCPKKYDHWTVDSLSLKDSILVFHCNNDKDDEYFRKMDEEKASIKDTIVKNLNENAQKLVKMCKENSLSIQYNFSSKVTQDGKTAIVIENKDLQADPAK